MKKSAIFVLVFFIGILLIGNSLAADSVASTGEQSVEGIRGDLEEGKEKIDDAKDVIEGDKEDYLSQEWKKIIRSKPVFREVDQTLSVFSFVFEIFMNEPYSLSFRFFIVLFLWIFTFINLIFLLRSLFFTGWLGYVIALALTLLLGLIGFFQFLYSLLGSFVGIFSGWKKWLVFVAIFVIFGILTNLRNKLSKYLEKQKEEYAKKQEETDRWFLNKLVSIYKKHATAV